MNISNIGKTILALLVIQLVLHIVEIGIDLHQCIYHGEDEKKIILYRPCRPTITQRQEIEYYEKN